MRKLIFILFLGVSNYIFCQNLISNGSFELNGQLDCSGWYDACGNPLSNNCDTIFSCFLEFDSETTKKTLTNNWCIKSYGGSGWIDFYIKNNMTGLSGTFVLYLQTLMKSEYMSSYYSTGVIRIHKKSQGQSTNISKFDTAITWEQISLLDTITLQATDTISIIMSALGDDIYNHIVYFDSVSLTILDTILSVGIQEKSNSLNILASPNPSNGIFNLQLPTNYATLFVYDVLGNLVKNEQISNNYSLNLKSQPNGVYFLKIKSEENEYYKKLVKY